MPSLKTVFLVDGLGALLTATLLMAIVCPFNVHFGMPPEFLPLLSITALAFAAYSLSCYLFNASKKFLLPIILANLTYCLLTLSLAIYFWHHLTFLGITYFLGEILIVIALISLELKTLKATRP